MIDWILALFVVLLQIPDILTTNAILAAGGRELNPVVRLLMRLGRFWWVPKFLLALVAALWLATLDDIESRLALMLLTVAYGVVVWLNLRQIGRMRRRRRL